MTNKELTPVETITPYEAGRIIHKNAEYIRALLRQGRVNWGTAAESKNGQWNYNIIKSKFLEYAGQTQEEIEPET